MKPQLLALLTAAAWGIGGYFEKKGLHLGNLPPQLGITIRTAVALVILGAVSAPHWKDIAAGRPPRPGLHDRRRRRGGGLAGHALLLRRAQGRAPDPGDAHRLHLAPVRRGAGA